MKYYIIAGTFRRFTRLFLMKEIKTMIKTLIVVGAATHGTKRREIGTIKNWFMGFVEVLLNLKTILIIWSFVNRHPLYQPDVVILVDYLWL